MWKLMCSGMLLASAACAAGPEVPATAFCVADVQGYANPEAGARGDFSPNVGFSSVRIGPGAIGYGAAGGRSDEITIAGGTLHLARPDGPGGYRQRVGADAGEGAYMLQLVDVEAWGSEIALPVISSLDALGTAISDEARSAGCGGPVKLAYRIEGRVRRAEWSLDTLPQRGDFVAEVTDVVIVGLFASFEQARHFVPDGRNIHAHAVFPALGVAGHLKTLELEPGARLQLQAR
jgi:hypothetical protein